MTDQISQPHQQTPAAAPRFGCEIRVVVTWPGLPGRESLHVERRLREGDRESVLRALESIRCEIEREAAQPLRPCGHPGPWWAQEAAG